MYKSSTIGWFSPIDWINLSLDDKTANKMLWISDSACNVCRRTEEVCPVLDRPERYECSPQVSHKGIYIQATNEARQKK